MNLVNSRKAALILVSEIFVSFGHTEKNVAVWFIDTAPVTGGRLARDLEWLWAAGLIEYTRPAYPTAVRLTTRGHQELKRIL